LIFSNIAIVYAQEESRKIEVIEIPASAFNATKDNPEVIPLEHKHIANFVVNLKNELIYKPNYDQAKASIRFGDNVRDKFFEIIMYGEPSKRLTVALFTDQLGYVKYYENDQSWFEDREIGISFMQNDKLSIHNGQRNIMDRLRIGEFTLDTLEVYGKENSSDLDNVIGGKVIVEVLSGNPLENPISFVPVIAVAVVGGVLVILLKTKKR
ncbi:MAG: hypothetical protein D6752_05515, partial [Candidatus Nitrosothermus koennekii]